MVSIELLFFVFDVGKTFPPSSLYRALIGYGMLNAISAIKKKRAATVQQVRPEDGRRKKVTYR